MHPYGINSHRLLVRGTRIFPEAAEILGEAELLDAWVVATLMALPPLLLLLLVLVVFRKRK